MCCEEFRRTNKRKIRDEQRRTRFLSTVCMCVFVCCIFCVVYITLILLILVRECVAITRRRIANLVGEDSCCREGIVHTRFDFSCALLVRPQSSKALWRFRVSTSNSPSGRSWLQAHTHIRCIYHTYAQQDIRVCGVDHDKPHMRQHPNPRAL